MKKDTQITEVVFRVDTAKDFKGTVFALLPHDVADQRGNVTIYQHIGQHGTADYNHCIRTSKPAIESEYADLKAEMESFGYNFKVIQKQNHKKYMTSYNKGLHYYA